MKFFSVKNYFGIDSSFPMTAKFSFARPRDHHYDRKFEKCKNML